jgi:multisubunit Na+/H+ antiporter MnhF subunit
MAQSLHPAASHDLPWFITAPGETDTLMVVMSVFLVLAVLTFGILFLRLHTLPERIAHKSHKLQFEIVAVLGLLALFTHMHIFWVIGLLLALIDFPDFGTSLNRIAGSAEKIAGIESAEDPAAGDAETTAGLEHRDGSAAAPAETGGQGIGAMALSTKRSLQQAKRS